MATKKTSKKTTKKSSKSKGKKVSGVVKVDFTDVEDGYAKVKDGDYLTKIVDIEQKDSQSGNPYLKWVLEISEGKHSGKKLSHITSLQSQALFNLKSTLQALGVEVPRSKMSLRIKDYLGLPLATVVENELYQGKSRSKVVEVYSAEDWEDEEDEEEEEEEEDDEEDEDEDDDDEDEEDDD